MLNKYARAFFTALFTPVARFFLRHNITPDMVTVFGTIGVVLGALIFFPLGYLWWGSVFITCFIFTDLIDGTMARLAGTTSRWGAFLDSTMDRIGDGAIFGGLVLYFMGRGDNPVIAYLALLCMILGFTVSYAKARAESLGMTASGGIAERADRLVIVLVATGFVGLFLPEWVLTVTLIALALASSLTVWQRMSQVREQTRLDG
ncbi:CDP-alcohol phosphatidyltransferase family protein [Ornithinimicrobium sp. Arc0846-15]|nr:CDP-alcohol phosphatidyltransferase family protein [Ornithinimicrobium laminariae]